MKEKIPVLMIMLIVFLVPNNIDAQTQKTMTEEKVSETPPSIVKVEAKNVCMGMGTNRVFAKELIPAMVNGKTYYGCCEGCQAKLLEDPASRVALDPISGIEVDKATAVIGALPSGVVHYFENDTTMQQFAELIRLKE